MRMKNKKLIAAFSVAIVLVVAMVAAYFLLNKQDDETKKYSVGLYLQAEGDDCNDISGYEVVIVDAAYFTKEQIQTLCENNGDVYSYINIGSLEDFRTYYDDFFDITLSDYEGWEEERWIDVSVVEWQNFCIDLGKEYLDKGVDGLFIDNTDVYYMYETDEMYNGLISILSAFSKETNLVINGGDVFINRLIDEGILTDYVYAINQESAFSDEEYYLPYIEKVNEYGVKVFLTEYHINGKTEEKLDKYCDKHGFLYCVLEEED